MAKRQKKGVADTTQIGWRLVGGVYIEYIIKRISTPWLVSDNGNVTNGKYQATPGQKTKRVMVWTTEASKRLKHMLPN